MGKNTKRLLAGIFVLCICYSKDSNCQIINPKQLYFNKVGDQLGLYNGTKYEELPSYFQESNPYFQNQKSLKGDIEYFHIKYEHVQFRYDILIDALVLEDSTHIIQLINDEIQSFTIDSLRFIHLNETENLQKGFYQILYDGKTKAYKKYLKFKKERIVSGELVGSFEPQSNIFILHNKHIYEIEGKKDILKIFADKKNKIKQFIHNNKLRFSKNPDLFVAKITAYYEL